MTDTWPEFIERLSARLPALGEAYRMKSATYEAEGLADSTQDLFLDEYTRDVLDAHEDGESDALLELAAALEAEYGEDAEIDHLIDAQFVLLLPFDRASGPEPGLGLGEKLTEALRHQRAWQPDDAYEGLVARLVEAVPRLEELARENGWGGEGVLIHSFMADLAAREVANVDAGDTERLHEAVTVLNLLERAFGEGPELDGPIALSFVANLADPDRDEDEIVEHLGPALSAEFRRQWPSRSHGADPT